VVTACGPGQACAEIVTPSRSINYFLQIYNVVGYSTLPTVRRALLCDLVCAIYSSQLELLNKTLLIVALVATRNDFDRIFE
jgi:hypothetical protein